MFQRKPRRFRRRPNGRGHSSRENGFMQVRPRPNSFSSGQISNKFRQTQSAEKLFEKYNVLAKEAMSTGDKTLGENYLQHADHFMRIIEEKNKNRDQNKVNIIDKTITVDKSQSEVSNNNQKDPTNNKE
tara:strand:+ start:86 stop:472 length:387 start_codon:yes stop_codon:yes gene_type:complete